MAGNVQNGLVLVITVAESRSGPHVPVSRMAFDTPFQIVQSGFGAIERAARFV